jgi:hypothetical protein
MVVHPIAGPLGCSTHVHVLQSHGSGTISSFAKRAPKR